MSTHGKRQDRDTKFSKPYPGEKRILYPNEMRSVGAPARLDHCGPCSRTQSTWRLARPFAPVDGRAEKAGWEELDKGNQPKVELA
jgi:hypothetical protein